MCEWRGEKSGKRQATTTTTFFDRFNHQCIVSLALYARPYVLHCVDVSFVLFYC